MQCFYVAVPLFFRGRHIVSVQHLRGHIRILQMHLSQQDPLCQLQHHPLSHATSAKTFFFFSFLSLFINSAGTRFSKNASLQLRFNSILLPFLFLASCSFHEHWFYCRNHWWSCRCVAYTHHPHLLLLLSKEEQRKGGICHGVMTLANTLT